MEMIQHFVNHDEYLQFLNNLQKAKEMILSHLIAIFIILWFNELHNKS
jgi:hypothetical protein